jgi:hypothetical protein
MRSAARPSASWSTDARTEVWSPGAPGLGLVDGRLSPIVSLDEAAMMLDLSPDEVRARFEVCGEPDDEGILREDVLEFLAWSEI